MNALNIISGLGSSTPSTPARSRTSSLANLLHSEPPHQNAGADSDAHDALSEKSANAHSDEENASLSGDEKTPLLEDQGAEHTISSDPNLKSWRLVPKRFADLVVTSVQVVLSTILAPITYIVACFYDSDGHFSAMLPIRRIYHLSPRKRRRKADDPSKHSPNTFISDDEFSSKPRVRPKKAGGMFSIGTTDEVNDAPDAEPSDENEKKEAGPEDSPAHNTRSKLHLEDGASPKRSTRIKIQTDASQKRGHRSSRSIDGNIAEDDRLTAVANSLKSPSSPVTKLKYPRAPAPPRPIVPRRQPSYSNLFTPDAPKKTLILDLDETLIHSMAKGGRMSTGHMVEVKFQGPVGAGGVVLGPQVPILYYVHERPHCHEFLRKVRVTLHGTAMCQI